MKKLFFTLLVLTIMFVGISCNNQTAETPKDFSELTAEQEKIYNEVSYDISLAMTQIKFDEYGMLESKPDNIEVTRVITGGDSNVKVVLTLTFSEYVGQTYKDKITGSAIFTYNYASINDAFYSSMSGTINVVIKRDEDLHSLSSNIEAKVNKNTGAIISAVETGTFDKAKYRISK